MMLVECVWCFKQKDQLAQLGQWLATFRGPLRAFGLSPQTESIRVTPA